ncbi:MAG: hypothetical protein ABR961_06895 [Thermoanaerobaculaceae bacterium]
MRKNACVVCAVCLGVALAAPAEPPKSGVGVSQQKVPPVPTVRTCIDVVVDSFTATLFSTQVGTPGIEFPTDTVTLLVVLKNAGNLPLPADATIELRLYRNNELLTIPTYTNILGAPGSRWSWAYKATFTHGVPTMFMAYAAQPRYQECDPINNNTAKLTINETLLHPARKTLHPR